MTYGGSVLRGLNGMQHAWVTEIYVADQLIIFILRQTQKIGLSFICKAGLIVEIIWLYAASDIFILKVNTEFAQV